MLSKGINLPLPVWPFQYPINKELLILSSLIVPSVSLERGAHYQYLTRPNEIERYIMNRLKTPFVSFLFTFVLFTLLMRTWGVAAASGWGPDAWNIVSCPNVGAA